jgi:NADH:ubiquinone oxidoreductase subunit K
MSSTLGGGWFSNNSVLLIAIVAFSIGKYSVFKHKKTKVTYYLMSPIACFFFAAVCDFVPAILVTCYLAVNVLYLLFLALIVYSIIYLTSGRPFFLLLEFYF